MTTSLYKQCDFHIHTRHSLCARQDMLPQAIIKAGDKQGVKYLGITDHIHGFSDTKVLSNTRDDLSSIESSIKVFLGCEADIVAVGKHAVTDAMRNTLDYIMVSANHIHVDGVEKPKGNSLEEIGRHFLNMFRYACTLDFVDIIAHPLIVFPGTYDPTCLDLLKDDELKKAIRLAKANNIAMEISPRALMRDQYYFKMRFYSLCKEAGLKFAIGSDAHSLENVGNTRILEPIISELGLEDEDIWLPKEGLEK